MTAAIVLAAGLSRRMGVQKLLLPYGGDTVVGHIVTQLLASTLDEVYVVVGHEGGRVRSALVGRPVAVVTNPDYGTGMLSSVRCGLRALPERCRDVLVALGDQPAVHAGLIDDMIRAFAAEQKGILVPCHDGRRGHPLLFSVRYRDEILAHYDRVGLRGLLQAHADDIANLPVSSPAVLADMDCPTDYRRELERFDAAANPCPSSASAFPRNRRDR